MARFGFRADSSLTWGDGGLLFYSKSKNAGGKTTGQ